MQYPIPTCDPGRVGLRSDYGSYKPIVVTPTLPHNTLAYPIILGGGWLKCCI